MTKERKKERSETIATVGEIRVMSLSLLKMNYSSLLGMKATILVVKMMMMMMMFLLMMQGYYSFCRASGTF